MVSVQQLEASTGEIECLINVLFDMTQVINRSSEVSATDLSASSRANTREIPHGEMG